MQIQRKKWCSFSQVLIETQQNEKPHFDALVFTINMKPQILFLNFTPEISEDTLW